jgi:hypothetical protein
MFEILSSDSLTGYSSELQQELQQNFVGVEFLRVELTKGLMDKKANLNVLIQFTTENQSDITDLLVTMPSIFDSNQFRNTKSLVPSVQTLQFAGDTNFSL